MDLSGSMRMGTCLGFDFYPTSRTTNNPDALIPTFGHYSSANANLQGPSTNQTSSYESYTISPSNTTAPNSSYSRTYINNFYQNAAYASTLVRAFDSYTSSDGGNTWSAPSSGAPLLPPTSYASVPGGDVPLFKSGSTTTMPPTSRTCFNSTSTNILWELDGYSAYAGSSLDTSGPGGVPQVWTQVDYSAPHCQFNGYTQGPGYYGKTFFIWPPDPRNTTAPISTALTGSTGWFNFLGITNTTDQNNLATNWSTWLGQGTTTGLSQPAELVNGKYDERRSLHPEQYYQGCAGKQQQGADLLCGVPALQPRLSGGDQQRQVLRGLADPLLRHQQQSRAAQRFRVVGYARQLHLYNQLQRDPELDHPVAEPLSQPVASGSHQVLWLDSRRRSPEAGPATAAPTSDSGSNSSITF